MTTPAPPVRDRALMAAAATGHDRHAALGLELTSLVGAGDHVAAGELVARWRADETVDPWRLMLALAGWAALRPCGRPHPPEGI